MKVQSKYLVLLAALVASSSVCFGADNNLDSTSVASAVETFHNALARGDGKAATQMLAADAVILESGELQTRAEYESHHLAEDIRFAQTVRSTRSDVHVEIEGNTAWLTSLSRAQGSFEGKPINSSGVELIVLMRGESGWRIRAIHWSSRKVKGNQ